MIPICKMTITGSRHFPLCCSLLCLLLVCVSTEGIIATVGSDVTLLCNYDAQYHGKLYACWGRGAIPNSGCANEVIRTDGTNVISRLSERYLLTGNVPEGDVSLTIRQVDERDSGTYGCRVEIPGWFNDHKHQLTLTVMAVRPNPMRVETREVKERAVTAYWTPGFDGGRPISAYRLDLKQKQASWDSAKNIEVNPELTQVTLMDLHPAKSYSLRMFAINSVGMSESSNVLTITTKEAAPEGPPLDVQLQALTSRTIKVTWRPPRADLRNGVLRSYTISYKEYDPQGKRFNTWHQQSVTATWEVGSTILRDLNPSTQYSVLIQATTNAGIGPPAIAPPCSTLDEVHTTSEAMTVKSFSTAATLQRQETAFFTSAYMTSTVGPGTDTTVWAESTSITSVPPDPPVVELKEVRDNSISLFWTPGFEGDSPITGYYLEYKPVNASWDYTEAVDFSPNETDATIIEINPSTYNIRMFAKNSLGISKPSNVLTITTGDTGQREVELVTMLNDSQVAAVVAGSNNGHIAAIVMSVILVVLAVAIFTTWQLRCKKQKQGKLNLWVTNRALRYKGAESLEEL